MAGSSLQIQKYEEKKFLNAYHLFVIQTENRKELYEFLKENEIYSQVHYIPVYKHPYYQKNGFGNLRLNQAESYYSKALSLPMFQSMKDEEFAFIGKKIKAFLEKF